METQIIDEPYKVHYKEESRHLSEGTAQILYRPWNDYDVIELLSFHPTDPLKFVRLGYGFWRDFKEGDILLKKTYSVSTYVTANVPKEGIKIIMLSYSEAVKKAKKIDWSKVEIEK